MGRERECWAWASQSERQMKRHLKCQHDHKTSCAKWSKKVYSVYVAVCTCVCMGVCACRQYRQTTFAVAQSRPSERVEVEVMARAEA